MMNMVIEFISLLLTIAAFLFLKGMTGAKFEIVGLFFRINYRRSLFRTFNIL